jgi:DNA-binding beta-propeller fold protein YncE
MLTAAATLLVAACTGGAAGDGTVTTTTTATTDPATSPPTTAGRSYAGTDPAPEFPTGLEWLNTATPPTMAGLRGKIVLLDFWTYGCINCIHIIPDLERLEAQYASELVVIGVHSAKFVNESATENIRQVVLRYGLEHPVVNDPDFAVWSLWGATAWPTTVLVDPAGNVVGAHAGEGVYQVMQPAIESLLAEFDGSIDRTPLPVSLEREGMPRTVLSFPGKVLADPAGGRLFIADTGHHRIVVADPETGEVRNVFGSGRPGLRDGPAMEAEFQDPQGLAVDGTTLYVADTGNHALRTVDLTTGEVATATGSGRQGRWPPTGGLAPGVDLTSPWDLALRDEVLYIAMAGTHQIWAMDLTTGLVGPLVGSGAEGTANGTLGQAELAQPSGLAFDEADRLYFADSESSAIRWADVTSLSGETGILAGSDRSLFDFGDVDGVGTAARLQHPLGVVFVSGDDGGLLYVADTYNSKIKRIDPATGQVTTIAGSGQGWADGGAPLFHEPGGITALDGTLWVADTNNHAVRRVDPIIGTTTTLVLSGIERFTPAAGDEAYRGTVVSLDAVTVGEGDEGEFVLRIGLPDGYKVNDLAPSSVAWKVDGAAVAMAGDADRSLTGVEFPVSVGAFFSAGTATVTTDVTVIYCEEDAESLCFIEQVRFVTPVTVAASGPDAVDLPYGIELNPAATG